MFGTPWTPGVVVYVLSSDPGIARSIQTGEMVYCGFDPNEAVVLGMSNG